MSDQEIEERREFLRRLKKLGDISDEHKAACDEELAAMKRRNAAHRAFVQYYADTEALFPNKQMPFYAESLWGPKPAPKVGG
ncbi:hypothetical protein [Paraburkholderia sacchari]|uniref:hypothetical protein n=1 Tax=Paraburkholderia sacchari TaxID=159450 RepID=UPI003D997319